MMNIIAASRLRAVGETDVNTIVGGVASEITTAQEFANKTSLSVADITNFQIVGDDIHMSIQADYTLNSSAFNEENFPVISQKITCYIDFDGRCTTINSQCFLFSNIKLFHSPSCRIEGFQNFRQCQVLKVTSAESSIPIGSNTTNRGVFTQGVSCDFITNIINETNNSGSPDGDITELLNQGGFVKYKDLTNQNQTTAPTAPTISASTIGGTYAELNVSQPTHVNDLKYALVFVDGFFNNVYDINNTYAFGLIPQTNYNIKVIIADEYFNISHYSNSISVTTGTNTLFQNAIAYYKLNETSGDAIDLINGYSGVDFGTIVKDGEWYNYGTNESYVEIADNDDFSFVDTQGDSTDFVIKTEVIFDGFNSQNRAWLVSKRESTTAGVQGWQLTRNESTGETIFAIWDDNNTLYVIRYTAPVVIGQKYILGVTFINNELRLFINGVRVATEPIPVGVTFANTSSVIKLGNETFTSNLNLVGRQKETVFIKGKGWTDGEISDNYNNGNGTTI